VLGKVDLSRIKIRLDNIRTKATRSISLEPSEAPAKMQEFYLSPTMKCLENMSSVYELHPQDSGLIEERSFYGYDESTQDFRALEGDLVFCSSAVIKIEEKYVFNLTVLPYFVTSMGRFKGKGGDEIRYTDNPSKERNKILVKAKTELILSSAEPHSVVLIDGPLVGGMASSYMVKMDEELRKKDCIPLYFVKNSDSRLVIENIKELSHEFNSDFHWASRQLKGSSRSAFFKYTDKHNPRNSKVFAYVKGLPGFTERVEMHSSTYREYYGLLSSLMNTIAYFYIVQGDFSNPQVRPIAIAEKYAREGLKILNIPVLLRRMGFSPTINQVRFGG
jgi:hypothetical protein